MLEFAGKLWCKTLHQKVMRPVCGHYRCAECLREWPVNWGIEVTTVPSASCSDIIPTTGDLSPPHVLA